MPSTSLEQYELELVNEARLNPLANAARYISSFSPLTAKQSNIQSALNQYGVNGTALYTAFAALVPVQPLAFNDALASAARDHNAAMIAADTQSHQLPGEADLGARFTSHGYTNWNWAGENIYAFASDALHGHAGFMVDWGPGPNGMQNPPGHRNSIMSSTFREIGIGIALESNPSTSVGPMLITEDFGKRNGDVSVYVLGVAYADSDRDGFYSVGEGVAGLQVALGSASVATAGSGGYTLASAVTGARTITLSGGGLSGTVSVTATLAASQNIKLDVIDGTTLGLSFSASVTGAISKIVGLGTTGLALSAGAGAQAIIGTQGHDTLGGGEGNDTLQGGAGNDLLNGGAGYDLGLFDGARAGYAISRSGLNVTVSGSGTTDTLSGVEELRFGDRVLDLTSPTDFGGDGFGDLVWRHDDGRVNVWTSTGTNFTGKDHGVVPTSWEIDGRGDFDADGKADLLWRHDDGRVNVWTSLGSNFAGKDFGIVPSTWHVMGAGDVSGDGRADIVWQNDAGRLNVWTSTGTNFTGKDFGSVGPNWRVQAVADFNADGRSDLLFRETGGALNVWSSTGDNFTSQAFGVVPNGWVVQDAADFNNDGRSDILWRNANGAMNVWTSTGAGFEGRDHGVVPTNWSIQGATDTSGDGLADLVWRKSTGELNVWTSTGDGFTAQDFGIVDPGWLVDI